MKVTRIECEDRVTAKRIQTRLTNGNILAITYSAGGGAHRVYGKGDSATVKSELAALHRRGAT